MATNTSKATRYFIESAGSMLSLWTKVENSIGKGWQPIGGVAIEVAGATTYYYQSMVKYKSEDDVEEEDDRW